MGRFFCIHCGNKESEVCRAYGKGNVMKLLECTNCGELIDKYMEYDTILIVINLVLQNKMAYRHVLLNTRFQIFWKLGIIFFFCEAYCDWCYRKGVEQKRSSVDFYELETKFYLVILRSLTNFAAFCAMILLLAFLKFNVLKAPPRPPLQFTYFGLFKGLCLCTFPEVFELCTLIWSYPNSNSELRILFVAVLILNSNSKSYEGKPYVCGVELCWT